MSKLWLLLFALTPLLKGEVKQQIILPNDYEVIEDNTIIANSPIPLYAKVYSAIADDVIDENEIEEIDIKQVNEPIETKLNNEELIKKILNCESGFDQSKIGKAGEIGIAQFMKTTWEMFNKQRGTMLDIHSEKDQVDMLDWALDNNLGNHWTCYRKIISIQ